MTAESAAIRPRPWPPLSAAVLAGGASRRMGTDKAMLSLATGGPPVIARVLDVVGQVADDVFVVASDRPAYRSFGVPIVPDRQPALGPIGGIATALEIARHDHCLVVACDLPLLEVELLAWMAALPRDYEALIPRAPAAAGSIVVPILQPLHAIYARASLPAIHAHIATGDLRLTSLAHRLRVRTIEADDLRTFDPDFRSFFNLNSPADARRAAELLGLRQHVEPAEPRSRSIEPRENRIDVAGPDDAVAPTEGPKNG